MPVRKFKTVEELQLPRWREPGDPALYRAIAHLWTLGHRLGVHRFPPGVHRARSIEEVDARSREWSLANFEAFRARGGSRS